MESHAILFTVPQEIDEYELVDPVDILSPLEKSGFWDGVVSVSFDAWLVLYFNLELKSCRGSLYC